MKTKSYIVSWFCIGFLGLFSTFAFAKEVTIFDQPNDKAKSVGKVDLSVGIIPIFSQKTGGWIKVADPRNGNVGWAKSSDLNDAHVSFSFTQSITPNGKPPKTYQIIEYGTSANWNSQEIQKMLSQQKAAQISLHKAMQTMIDNMNNIFQPMSFGGSVPIMMPVIIVPSPTPVKPASSNNQQKKP